MIVDTCFLIDLLQGDKSAVNQARNLELRGEQMVATGISVFELWQGSSMENPTTAQRVSELIDSMEVLNLDLAAAKEGGNIARTLIRTGLATDPEDCMIAGIARCHKEGVLTRNHKHFSRIAGLHVETY